MDKLRQLGGVSGLADTVQSHAHHGLDPSVAGGPASIEEHRRVFGANTMPPMAQKNFFVLCFENIQDPIILLLIAAALVSCTQRLQLTAVRGLGNAAFRWGRGRERAGNSPTSGIGEQLSSLLALGLAAASAHN
jgi:hypothetical protein